MSFIKQYMLLCLITLINGVFAKQAPPPPAPIVTIAPTYQKITPETLAKITHYWNSLRIIVSDIIQTNPDGTKINGKLYLKKEGKYNSKNVGNDARLRVDYQADYKQLLLIKKSEVLLVDLTDGAVAAYPVSMTPAGLILKSQLNFATDVKLIDSRQVGDDVQIVLAHNDDENGGTLTLNFTLKGNISLLRWKILDPQGNITEVELNVETIRLNDEKLVPDSFF